MQVPVLALLEAVAAWVWGPPLVLLLVGTGVYLTVRLRLLQIRLLPHALYLALVVRREPEDRPGDISHFQALMTALAATVGTGNIAGVATAVTMGGPGALFWMWVTGLFGMATKYAEAVLAVRYRRIDAFGTMCGGPMYYLTEGLGRPGLGTAFALFGAVAAFGIGNTVQSNSVAQAAAASFGIEPWLTGVVLCVATAAVILGGIRSIGRAASALVPAMVVLYVGAGLYVLWRHAGAVPAALAMIVEHAFAPAAAVGGFAGAGVRAAIQMGIARGVFSNESGLGSSPIAAAAARTRHPVAQALVSMTQTFIDTLVVCTITGLVLLVTGAWTSGATGAELTARAFSLGLPGTTGHLIVTVSLILFAYTTLLGWSYYGEKCVEYLAGERTVAPYRVVFCLAAGLGAVVHLELVWAFADIMNGLMAVPNLIGLLGLAGVVVAETNRYLSDTRYTRGSKTP